MKSLQDIYFINATALATDIRNGAVSENRAVKHLIASLVLGGTGFTIPISVEAVETTTSNYNVVSLVLSFIIIGVITYYGVWLTQQVNSKGDGKDFFMRFAALSLPIGIQLSVLFLGVGICLLLVTGFLAGALGMTGFHIGQISFYVAGVIFAGLFFLRMRVYIALASGAEG